MNREKLLLLIICAITARRTMAYLLNICRNVTVLSIQILIRWMDQYFENLVSLLYKLLEAD